MRAALLFAAILVLCAAHAQDLPEEVARFLGERSTCEHFLGEPVEGRSAEQRERRDFVAESIDIYCSGTDRRLAALKRRYAAHPAAMAALRALQEKLE
jgi:hypothetical protein